MRKRFLALAGCLAGCVAEPEPTPGPGSVVINEVAPAGDPHDWFEIINTSDRPIELSDFVFVDRQLDFARARRFPEGTLHPGGRHVQEVLRMEHGFQLGASEGLFVYHHEDRLLIDRVAWKKSQAPRNGSYARVPDGSGRFRPSRRPTPGAENAAH
jgi:hypothetical protein